MSLWLIRVSQNLFLKARCLQQCSRIFRYYSPIRQRPNEGISKSKWSWDSSKWGVRQKGWREKDMKASCDDGLGMNSPETGVEGGRDGKRYSEEPPSKSSAHESRSYMESSDSDCLQPFSSPPTAFFWLQALRDWPMGLSCDEEKTTTVATTLMLTMEFQDDDDDGDVVSEQWDGRRW